MVGKNKMTFLVVYTCCGGNSDYIYIVYKQNYNIVSTKLF